MSSASKYGLIGYPLTHSFSQRYFTDKFQREHIKDSVYANFPLENINDFPELLGNNKDLIGLNVTIPHKETVIPFLDGLDPVAEAIGAVNTIKISADGAFGFNTDAYGFETSMKPFLKAHHTRALILGTGGASKAVAYVLKNIGLDILYASRNPKAENELGYDQINEHVLDACKLIVNTTPLGTYPNIEGRPQLPYELLTNEHFLYDLVYNPEKTKFLELGEQSGAAIKNGYDMLAHQAEKAWKIWNA